MTWADKYDLALLPLALTAAWWIFRRSGGAVSVQRFTNIKRLWADRRGLSDSATVARRRARGILLALGAACALVALARPQWGTVEEGSFDQAREVMIALDLSRSMLADDVKPTRLARAKLLIESLLDQIKGERVGLVVFSGTAFVQSPLSADYEVMRDLLKDLDPSYLPQGGTDYGAMLSTAANAFGQTGDGDRYLVVFSDGEAHDDTWQQQLETLRQRGIRVIGLGVGTAEGAMLPDKEGGLLKDDKGGAVLSRLEPATLQQLAEQTHGVYRDAATWVDIADLVRATVDQGVKGRYVEEKQVRHQERFEWFLAPAFLFLLLSYWLELPAFPTARALRRQPPLKRELPKEIARAAALLLAVLIAPQLASAATHEPNALETTVAELSAKPALAATDYAQLAQQTIDFASKPNAPSSPARTAVIDDALTAVNAGESADPHAADWSTLRQQLEQLKQAQQQQPKQQENQPQPQNENSGGQQDQQQGQEGTQQQSQNGQSQNGTQGQPSQRGPAGGDAKSGEEKPQSAGSKEGEQQAGKPNADAKDASGSPQSANEKKGEAGESKEQKASAPHDVAQNKEQKPLTSPDAGLGKLDDKTEDAPAAETAADSGAKPAAQPATRLVGGGNAKPDKALHGDPALAAALGKMEQIKEGDAPAVLFDRMSQADNPRPRQQTGKNW